MIPPEKYIPTQPMKLVTGLDENRHYLRAFIQTYRELPLLWDTSLRDYTNRDKRAEAYEQLVPIYRCLKRDATVEDVKKKINTLRTNYRKELKVVECARRSGSLHQPRCWMYHELDFLRNAEKFLAVNPNVRNDPLAFSENSQSQVSFMDAHNFGNFKSLLNNGTTTVQSPPNITEMFHKSFGHTEKLEPQQTTPPPPARLTQTPDCHTHYHSSGQQHDHLTASIPSSVKRQRHSPASTSNNTGTTVQNADELLSMACDYLSGTFPEEESIARTWTHKLKRMQREQRLLAEKFINEILFEGESGTLHRGSVQINSFEPFVRFEEQQQQQHQPQDEDHAKSQSPSVHTSQEPDTKHQTSVAETTVTVTPTESNFPNYN